MTELIINKYWQKQRFHLTDTDVCMVRVDVLDVELTINQSINDKIQKKMNSLILLCVELVLVIIVVNGHGLGGQVKFV